MRNPLLFKWLIVAGLVVVGYAAVTQSLATVLATKDPVTALSVSASDARVVGRAAQLMMETAKTDWDRAKAADLARSALSRDGTVMPAIATVGLFTGLKDSGDGGTKWFAFAERLSRRDLRTQLYFIEKSVSEGNIAEALHHYDIALRTSEQSAPTVLYPVLRAAIADDTVRREFAKTLAQRPLWAEAFISDLVVKGPDFVVVADLLTDARRRGASIPPLSDQGLMNNLVAKNQISAAWRYYLAVHPGADKKLIRNEKFSPAHEQSSPFDWQISDRDGISGSFGAGDNGQAFDYRLSPTIGGPVVSQMMLMEPGKYRFQSTLISASQGVGAGPYWELKCASGPPIGILELGGSGPRTFALDIIVPQKCGVQLLTLIARPSDDVQGAAGQIGSVTMMRMP